MFTLNAAASIMTFISKTLATKTCIGLLLLSDILGQQSADLETDITTTTTATSAQIATTPSQRAQCQCTVDGYSGNTDVLHNEFTGKLYESENVVTGGPYKFIGCGAHTRYRDDVEKQIGGYPWKFCYTYGGRYDCQITELSRKHSLNSDVAYRFCSGDYDCKTRAQVRVSEDVVNDFLLDTIQLEEVDQDGYLKDWTNCCQECRLHGPGCRFWDFSVETMQCRLFSTIENVEQVLTEETSIQSSEAPMWFFGEPGFDDKPLNCWRRNRYDTCAVKGPRFLLIFGIIATIWAALIFFVIKKCLNGKVFRMGSTNDVVPGYTRTVTRTVRGKHGSHTKHVTEYTANIKFRTKGLERHRRVARDGKCFWENRTLYFKFKEDNPMKITLFGFCDTCCFGCKYICPFLVATAGLTCLFLLSLQVITTDGGRVQAKYVLPGQGRRITWAISMVLFAGALSALFVIYCLDVRERKTVRDEDAYDRLEKQKETKEGREESTDEVVTGTES